MGRQAGHHRLRNRYLDVPPAGPAPVSGGAPVTPSRRLLAIAGGVGAIATGTAAAAIVAAQQRRQSEDQYVDEQLGELKPDRTSTVAAEDGTPLSVEEIDPEDGGEPEVTLVGVHGFALSRKSWHFQRRAIASLRLPRVRQVYYDHRSH